MQPSVVASSATGLPLPDSIMSFPHRQTSPRTLFTIASVTAIHAALLTLVLQYAPPPVTPPTPVEVTLIETTPHKAPAPVKPPEPAPPVKTPPKPQVQPVAKPQPTTPTLSREPSPVVEPAPAKVVAQSSAPAAPAAAAAATTSNTASEPVITAARFDADYLHNPAPAYPAFSRRTGEEGKVILRVQVNSDGSALQVEIRTSSGFPRLDQAALDTVKRWRFVPARQGDKPVVAFVLVPIVFKLNG